MLFFNSLKHKAKKDIHISHTIRQNIFFIVYLKL